MPRDIAIGIQDFAKIRRENKFYIDKTFLIKEWWENGGKPSIMSTTNQKTPHSCRV
jgi:hypothetical protein